MNMREKIARAILSKVPQGYGMTEAEASEYADAVLDALMAPTKAMTDAAWDAHEAYEKAEEGSWLGPKSIFTAMIQAAKEGK